MKRDCNQASMTRLEEYFVCGQIATKLEVAVSSGLCHAKVQQQPKKLKNKNSKMSKLIK